MKRTIDLLWVLGMLVPSIGLVWTGTTEGHGDRFSYLQAMGVCVMGAGAWSCCACGNWRWVAEWRGGLLDRAAGLGHESPIIRLEFGRTVARRLELFRQGQAWRE